MTKLKILVSRTDRAGDLLLTLPVFRELRKAFPDAFLIAHARKYTAPIFKLCPEADKVLVDDDYEPGIFSTSLTAALKEEQIDRAIIVHPSARSIMSAFRAGIPCRVGRASNIWQFFLNDRRVQKRSRNEKHEFMYNLDLLNGLVKSIDYKPYRLVLPEDMKKSAEKKISELGMTKAVIVHPGHGGSARNLSASRYAELVQELLKQKIKVIISFGPGEDIHKKHFPPEKQGELAYLTDIPDMAELACLFSTASAFIGGSTGPLHLAAGVNLPTAAFFPPVRAMTPVRWGPAGNEALVSVPAKPAVCEGKCDNCPDSGCMDKIDLTPAINFVKKYQQV